MLSIFDFLASINSSSWSESRDAFRFNNFDSSGCVGADADCVHDGSVVEDGADDAAAAVDDDDSPFDSPAYKFEIILNILGLAVSN